MRRRPAAAPAAACIVGLLAVGACSTTVDPSAMTDPPERAPSSTLFVVDGAASTLLDRLVDEARGLSEAIVENDGDEELVARIEALWGAARPDVASAVPDLLAEFDRAVAMMDSAVARRRHADADKALNNLRHLIAALPPLE